jgi:Type ISP C-terminal specificity domain
VAAPSPLPPLPPPQPSPADAGEGAKHHSPAETGESARNSSPDVGRVYINAEQYFDGVPTRAWHYHIGGYQVCAKWLKDRKGRQLTYDDITHYHRTVAALNETIDLQAKIDEAIPSWPIQ